MFQRTKICSGLLIAFGSSLLAVAPGAFAQDTTVQRVEITGSAIRRVDAETAVPVTVIKADDLKAQGITSTEQILASITASQVTTSTSQIVGASSGGASFADIHSLGDRKTLVLLNGHRLANNAFDGGAPDLNMIPFAAIDRVEVLRDGASSLYGTDAIAGVINFITRRDFNGGNISIGMDAPQHPGGLQRDVNMGFGFGDLDKNGINVFGFVDFGNSQRISGTQRPFNTRFPGGLSPTPFPANYFQDGTVVGNPAAPGCNSAGLTTAADPADHTSCQEATASFVDYTPRVERASGYAKATIKTFGDGTFSLEGFLSHDKVTSQIAPVPYGGLYMNPFLPDGVTPNPYYPGHAQGPTPSFTLDPAFTASAATMAANGLQPGFINVKYRDLSHGPRTDTPTNDQFRVLGSFEGSAADWNYSVNALMSQNTVHDFVSGYSDGTIITPAVRDGVINPFSLTQSAAGNAAIASSAAGGLLQIAQGTLYSIDGHVDRELQDWFHAGHAATIALGLEARDEKFVDHANVPVATKLVASTGISPDLYQAGTRRIYAGFTELNIPVLKSLDFTLAARYDHYSDFGNTTNPKASFRFEPTKAFLVRGSFSTGFRAPTLYDINAAESYGTPGTVDDPGHSHQIQDPAHPTDPTATICAPNTGYSSIQVCNIQPEVLNGGNKNLKPEKSRNATLGIVLEPFKDFTFGVDAYRVSYTNQITSLAISSLTDPTLYPQFQQYYHRNGLGVPADVAAGNGLLSTDGSACPGTDCGYIDTRTQNLGGVITDGLDLSSTYKTSLGSAGALDFTYSSTWVHKFGVQNFKGDSYHQNVGVYFDGAPVFRWQHYGSVVWTLKPFTVGLDAHYKSGYIDADASNKVKSYATMDAYLGWSQGAKGLSATFGVRNLFDRDPPYSNQTDVFQANYDPRFADPTGRTFYGRLGYSF